MNYNIKVEPIVKQMTLAEIPDGSLALVLDGEFKGELFFKNVAGLHSISKNRYWKSDYTRSQREHQADGFQGPLSAACQLISTGDILKIEEAK